MTSPVEHYVAARDGVALPGAETIELPEGTTLAVDVWPGDADGVYLQEII